MLEYVLLNFGSLFAIVDPVAAIPAFLAMTARESPEQRRRTARTASLTCGLVLTVFALLGSTLFRFFGITLPAFQIAGGLILLLAALDMLRAKRSPLKETPEETEEGIRKEDIAIAPLAIPMLSGPGAITTAILLSGQADTWAKRALFYGSIAAVAASSFLVLTLAASGAKRLGPTFLNTVTRLMGLLLAAIGVQFILSALKIP